MIASNIRSYFTEQLYIHTKLMIVDDKRVIVSNDYSL